MPGYAPLYIKANETGLVQSRIEFLLPDDAYPTLENAFVWRERIKRKQGAQLLGRLRRLLVAQPLGNTDGAGAFSGNIKTILSLEAGSDIEIGSIEITIGAATFIETDPPDGTLTDGAAGTGTINYITGAITIAGAPAATAITIDFGYFPSLPVMGLRSRELNNINNEMTIAFDQTYAYRYVGGWQEFIPGTTWNGTDSDFFWSTNYWVGDANLKIFWVTNFNQSNGGGDPIRYTNGSSWIDFAPTINAAGDRLTQCLAMLPFRGRLVTFNTFEGANLAASVQMRQRIRWAAIGNPFSDASAIVTNISANAWRDDIRGKGGFLDIPTNEDIVSVGYVRDNLVIYCERSTWQLRYTGRSIAPFQIEKVNTELGAESTFSAVQFDTSLLGIGDKGIVQCDSFKSELIDVKIPDLVLFDFNNNANGTKRVHGIRDFIQRLAFWTYPEAETNRVFPNKRLVYNYENDSWAIFTDSFTCFGVFQPTQSRRWLDFPGPDEQNQWRNQNYPWINQPTALPEIIAGNQQGYTHLPDIQVSNDSSLKITAIAGNDPNVTVITSPNHNLSDGYIIEISGILTGTDFEDLNDTNFSVEVLTANTFQIYEFNPLTQKFDIPNVYAAGTYLGGGQIAVRDNFRIVSKKFNFLDQGQNIQIGYIDVLVNKTSQGAFSLYVYSDYNNNSPINIQPQNNDPDLQEPDEFFNNVIPTTQEDGLDSSKLWKRVFCPSRGAFLTLEWTLSEAQLNGPEQESEVEIQAQIVWRRPAGNQLPPGV